MTYNVSIDKNLKKCLNIYVKVRLFVYNNKIYFMILTPYSLYAIIWFGKNVLWIFD